MASKQTDWMQIEREYCAGTPLPEICKRFGITLAKLMDRIRGKGWKRDKRDSAGECGKPTAAASEGRSLTVITQEKVAEIVDEAVAEAVEDIVEAHRGLTRKLRERLDTELAEFDEMTKYLATFRDEDHIRQLTEQDDGGKALREYLTQCTVHHSKRAETIERLSRIGSQVVNLERAVWNLEHGESDRADSFESLLDEMRRPLRPNRLSDKVIQFENRTIARNRARK